MYIQCTPSFTSFSYVTSLRITRLNILPTIRFKNSIFIFLRSELSLLKWLEQHNRYCSFKTLIKHIILYYTINFNVVKNIFFGILQRQSQHITVHDIFINFQSHSPVIQLLDFKRREIAHVIGGCGMTLVALCEWKFVHSRKKIMV